MFSKRCMEKNNKLWFHLYVLLSIPALENSLQSLTQDTMGKVEKYTTFTVSVIFYTLVPEVLHSL